MSKGNALEGTADREEDCLGPVQKIQYTQEVRTSGRFSGIHQPSRRRQIIASHPRKGTSARCANHPLDSRIAKSRPEIGNLKHQVAKRTNLSAAATTKNVGFLYYSCTMQAPHHCMNVHFGATSQPTLLCEYLSVQGAEGNERVRAGRSLKQTKRCQLPVPKTAPANHQQPPLTKGKLASVDNQLSTEILSPRTSVCPAGDDIDGMGWVFQKIEKFGPPWDNEPQGILELLAIFFSVEVCEQTIGMLQ